MSRRITERYRLDKLVRASAAASVFRATDLRSDATTYHVVVDVVAEEEGDGKLGRIERRFERTIPRRQQ